MNINEILLSTQTARTNGSVVGYTSGVFDLLHDGHRNYLRQCKRECDFLVVGVDVDALVKRNKGEDRPFDPELHRLKNVLATEAVSAAFLKATSAETIIPALKPDRYFVPNSRVLTSARLSLVVAQRVELIVIPYTDSISTTALSERRKLSTGN